MNPLSLIPMNLAVPVYVAPEDMALGSILFQGFVHEEFEHQGVADDELLEDVEHDLLENAEDDQVDYTDESLAVVQQTVFQMLESPSGFSAVQSNVAIQIGSNIRSLAKDFEKSHQRRQVKQEADDVDLRNILNKDCFWHLLEEVFRDGVNRYNLIALFYFCSDILIRCVKSQLRDLGIRLFRWALQYIIERVCRWVAEHGGWEGVFRHRNFKYSAAVAFAILGVVGWYTFKGVLR